VVRPPPQCSKLHQRTFGRSACRGSTVQVNLLSAHTFTLSGDYDPHADQFMPHENMETTRIRWACITTRSPTHVLPLVKLHVATKSRQIILQAGPDHVHMILKDPTNATHALATARKGADSRAKEVNPSQNAHVRRTTRHCGIVKS